MVDAGVTIRVAGDVVTPDWKSASDHVTFHGAVPVRSARMEAEPPGATVVLPLTCAVGLLMTVTFCNALDVQLPGTDTDTLKGPVAGAVKVICAVPWPEVMVPPESVHAYPVAPVAETEATFPTDEAQTEDASVSDGEGQEPTPVKVIVPGRAMP